MAKKKKVVKKSKKNTSKVIKKKKKKLSKQNAKKRTTKKSRKTSRKSPKKKISPKLETASLQVGDQAPIFILNNQSGQEVALESLRGNNVILFFYPKDMTPGCTQEACDFRDSLNRIKEYGGIILGISKDDESLHTKFIEKYHLNFDLLADTSGSVCNLYGVFKEKNMYGKKYMGIERTTFLINKEGRISRIYPKVKVEGHVQEIIRDLAAL